MNRLILAGLAMALAAALLVSHMSGGELPGPWSGASTQEAQSGVGGVALAGTAGEGDEALMRAQLRLQELEQELRSIQEQVLAENEEFQTRAQEIDDRLLERMEEIGHEGLRDDVDELEQLLQRVERGEISQQEAEAQLQEQAEIHLRLQQAHQEALQDPEFAESLARDQQALSEDVFAAMAQRTPRTEEILLEMEAIEAELMQELMDRGEIPPGDVPQ